MNTENNKLMTEFLGYKLMPCRNGMAWERPTLSSIHDTLKLHGRLWRESDKLYYQYHCDWNWLMLVVEKIEMLLAEVEIRNHQTKIIGYGREITQYSPSRKIEAVYKACIEFIKWYNKTQS